MFKLISKIFILFLLFTGLARSEKFDNILINGNVRISDETIIVFSELPSENFLDENSINNILKRLYKSGFFKNIAVKIENKNLIIEVLENPIIQTVFIEGIKKKKLEESLYEVLSLKNRSSFNSLSIKKDVDAITSLLKNSGYYFSNVVSSTQDLGSNKINLFYKVDLGKKARITKISFIGDKKFKDSTLRNIILSEEFKFWKIISGKKFLNEGLINFDKNLMNNFYKNKGFYDVVIDSSFANYLGNDQFELIYNIASGKKYYFNDLSLELPIDYEDNDFNELKNIFTNLKGKPYSLNSINKILKEIDKIVMNEQYEFLKSTVNEKINDNLINLTFNIEESEKFYVEKINIYGNQFTLEETIRNSLIVDEGDPYNEILFNKSINNLKSKNFFKKVETKLKTGSSKSFKIVDINVEEKPTGEISLGAGVGSTGGSFGGGIKENNFLGKGISLDTNFVITADSLKGAFTYARPNFNYTDNTLFTSISSTATDSLKEFGYKTNTTSFSIGTKFEQFENINFSPELSSTYENLETTSTASSILKKQTGDYLDVYFNYSLDYDMRDQRYQTKSGFRSFFYQEIPLNSKLGEIINSYQFTKFQSLFSSDMIGKISISGKAVNSIKNENVRVSKRLYIPYSKLRGFEYGKLGPVENDDYVGGNYSSTINLSTTLPQILPSFQNIDFTYFIDIGNVWGVDYNESLDKKSSIRSATGIGMDFLSPIGPLSFSLTQPITKKSSDKTETFRFNLGTTF